MSKIFLHISAFDTKTIAVVAISNCSSDCKTLKSAIYQDILMNQLEFWHADKHSRNVKDHL